MREGNLINKSDPDVNKALDAPAVTEKERHENRKIALQRKQMVVEENPTVKNTNFFKILSIFNFGNRNL